MARRRAGRLSVRVALYYAPAPEDALALAGRSWLGRDPESGATVPQPAIAGIAELTAEPRHYGLHATLRAPMRLAVPWEDFMACARAVAAQVPAFPLPRLKVAALDGFLALVPAEPCPALRTLADLCVTDTEEVRAPIALAERERRLEGRLSARQEAMLQRWGYPFVFEEWGFHMTLTRRLGAADLAGVMESAVRHFDAAVAGPRRVTDLSVFSEWQGEAMRIAERVPLSAAG